MLKDIISCIEGPYIVADGALLGLMREGDLLEFDDKRKPYTQYSILLEILIRHNQWSQNK